MSNPLLRRLCLQAGAVLVASGWLVSTGYSHQSGGGVFSLGITDEGKVAFAWDANAESDVAGYKLYIGTVPGVYGAFVDMANVTGHQLTGLIGGMRYYFALTAYNTAGVESGFSDELTWQIPWLNAGRGFSANDVPKPPPASGPLSEVVPEAGTTNGVVPGEAEELRPINSPPFISAIADQAMLKNHLSAPITFIVSDTETPAAALQVTASSSNPKVLPVEGLILEGSEYSRSLTIDPTNGRAGVSIVTVSVTDGGATTSLSFAVTVGHPAIEDVFSPPTLLPS